MKVGTEICGPVSCEKRPLTGPVRGVSEWPSQASLSWRTHIFSGMASRRMSMSAATFPARFAELVYLLAHEPDATAEHERVLGEAVEASAAGDVSLATSQLNVDLQHERQSSEGLRLH